MHVTLANAARSWDDERTPPPEENTMANYADTLAAFDAAQAELAATATADLLTTAYSLTHRMDRAADRAGDVTRHRAVRAASREQHRNLRAQRDLITAELVRRGDGDR